MAEPASSLAAQQYAFAAHLRDPEQAPPPGIEDQRLQVYRDLFFNNVDTLLAGNFPVLQRILGPEWTTLVRDFYREHRCRTPLFPELGREMLQYLEARAQQQRLPRPFALELAHYEWVELALSLDDTRLEAIECDPDGDLLAGIPVVSPLAWPLAYRWPVQRIAPEFQPESEPQAPTFLLVLRDRHDEVRFKQIDALGYRLMQALHDNEAGASGQALLAALARETGAGDSAAFVASGGRLLQQLRERDAILGTRPR